MTEHDDPMTVDVVALREKFREGSTTRALLTRLITAEAEVHRLRQEAECDRQQIAMLEPENAALRQRHAEPADHYLLPIARSGEQQFGAIIRNRSGESEGEIDMGARDITPLCESDQQDAVDSAFALYESFCDQTGKHSQRHVDAVADAWYEGWSEREYQEGRNPRDSMDAAWLASQAKARLT